MRLVDVVDTPVEECDAHLVKCLVDVVDTSVEEFGAHGGHGGHVTG
jgi:hypothetical protein